MPSALIRTGMKLDHTVFARNELGMVTDFVCRNDESLSKQDGQFYVECLGVPDASLDGGYSEQPAPRHTSTSRSALSIAHYAAVGTVSIWSEVSQRALAETHCALETLQDFTQRRDRVKTPSSIDDADGFER